MDDPEEHKLPVDNLWFVVYKVVPPVLVLAQEATIFSLQRLVRAYL